jgi:phosphoglycerate dehydrogenase-like enzyme
MKVIGVDPKDLPPNVTVSRMVYPSQLDSVLPLADVVFVSAPLTPESRHMMGRRQFDLMKKGSYFVAVSRGGLYDTPSLVKALDSNHLAGAGLDVTDPEPLPQGHPLWKFPNVVLTPHVAGNSPGSYARRVGGDQGKHRPLRAQRADAEPGRQTEGLLSLLRQRHAPAT